MAIQVSEIMNRELFTVPRAMAARRALESLLSVGASCAPVVDTEGHPCGVVSVRDLVDCYDGAQVVDRMSAPAAVVQPGTSIEEAARLCANTGYHHLCVVDSSGRLCGFVSAIDALRGLLGMPARHLSTFPHLDRQLGVAWSDEHALEEANMEKVPEGPGVLVIGHGGAGIPETLLWLESAEQLRARLRELLRLAPSDAPTLRHWIDRGNVRFRVAAVDDPARRRRAVEVLRATAPFRSPLDR